MGHNGYPAGHGHGFFLVVGDHQAGHAHFLQNIHQFQLHFGAQFFVQRAHGLVQQQQLRALCQRAGQGHTLLLAT